MSYNPDYLQRYALITGAMRGVARGKWMLYVQHRDMMREIALEQRECIGELESQLTKAKVCGSCAEWCLDPGAWYFFCGVTGKKADQSDRKPCWQPIGG